jgi:acetate kinase
LNADPPRRAGSVPPPARDVAIPVAVSARHVHLTERSVEALFGPGATLRVHAMLRQPGQFAAEQTVTLIGPKGRVEHVRVVGPPRTQDQVELSRSDELVLGIDAPLRESGHLQGTPGITLEGPAGRVHLDHGVVCSLRHLHVSPADAVALGLKDQQRIAIHVAGERALTFDDIVVRVAPDYRLEVHLDTDEGNAAGIGPQGAFGRLDLDRR